MEIGRFWGVNQKAKPVEKVVDHAGPGKGKVLEVNMRPEGPDKILDCKNIEHAGLEKLLLEPIDQHPDPEQTWHVVIQQRLLQIQPQQFLRFLD